MLSSEKIRKMCVLPPSMSQIEETDIQKSLILTFKADQSECQIKIVTASYGQGEKFCLFSLTDQKDTQQK